MKFDDLPIRWKEHVKRYLVESGGKYSQISLADFMNNLRIRFEDGSSSEFIYAFYLVDNNSHELGVFTEHNGYHIFPFCVSSIETVNNSGDVIKTETFLID